MTQEEKQLLLKDLCARLPYGIIIAEFDKYDNQIRKFKLQAIWDSGCLEYDACRDGEQYAALYSKVTGNYCKPYLRPMSSMTEEERNEATQFEINNLGPIGFNWNLLVSSSSKLVDWLNSHHFDYRGLIERGLALEAPKGMYKED